MKFAVEHRTALIRFGKILAFAALVLGTTKLTRDFGAVTSPSTAAFSFLIIVLLSAFLGDLAVAITTSLVATLCYDYFYLPPVGTFTIAAFSDWISLAAFLLASVIISRLTASAYENKVRANALNKALEQLKEFGEWLLSMPDDQLTFSGIADKAMHVFSLEYCAIHAHGDVEGERITGTAVSQSSRDVEDPLKIGQDHATDVMEFADENMLGVRYMPINKGTTPLAVLAVKSDTLPAAALGAIASLIGGRLGAIGGSRRHP